jgi:hypothetical protein
MTSWAEIQRLVMERAESRCEYCRMHQSLQGATFHIEHLRPIARGGMDDFENLALACPGCNLCKADRIELPATTGTVLVPMFNPREDAWSNHFTWNGFELVGLTDVGRALVEAFSLNSPRRLRIRQAEAMFGLFPPA